jgi:O-antigen/teichoic acid export membrane protein
MVHRLKPLLLMSGYLGKALTQVVILFAFARISGAHGAGEFAFALAICTPVFAVSELALRNILQTIVDAPSFRSFFLIRLVTASSACALVGVPALLVGGFPPVGTMMPILIMRAADSMLDICFGNLQAQHRVGTAAAWMWANTALTLVAVGLSMAIGTNAVLAIDGSALASVAVLLILGPRMLAGVGGAWLMVRTDAKRVLRAGITLGAAQGCESLLIYLPTLYLTWGSTKVAVGVFAVCQYVVTLGNMAYSSVMQTSLSYMRKTYAEGGVVKLISEGRRSGVALVLLGVATAAAAIGVYPYIAPVIFGGQFDIDVWQMLPLGIAAVALSTEYATTALQLVLNHYQSRIQASLLGLGLVALVTLATSANASVVTAGYVLLAGLIGRALWSAVSLVRILGRVKKIATPAGA